MGEKFATPQQAITAKQRGRRTKYSDELAEAIVRTLSSGVPKKYAAESNGIGESTLYDWMAGEGGIPKGKVAEFSESITRAEAQAVVARIARIAKAGINGDWKADSWYLEHVHSDVFASRETRDTKISDANGEPFKLVIERVTS